MASSNKLEAVRWVYRGYGIERKHEQSSNTEFSQVGWYIYEPGQWWDSPKPTSIIGENPDGSFRLATIEEACSWIDDDIEVKELTEEFAARRDVVREKYRKLGLAEQFIQQVEQEVDSEFAAGIEVNNA